MKLTVICNNMQIHAVCDDQVTRFRVEYKGYRSLFHTHLTVKTHAMVQKRIQRELEHIRSNNIDTISKDDVYELLNTFNDIILKIPHAHNTKSLSA